MTRGNINEIIISAYQCFRRKLTTFSWRAESIKSQSIVYHQGSALSIKSTRAEQLSLKQWLKYGKLLQGAILQAGIINAFKQSFLDAAQFGCRWYG
jgi:hypothetical protein